VTSHIDQLRAEAAHQRRRRDLYKAKVYGPRATSQAKLEELDRAVEVAESRLRRAERG
jgi:hypothetical protein